MDLILDHPMLVLAFSLMGLYVSEWFGVFFHKRRPILDIDREDFNLIVASTLTLLGLIIGFTFSMAISRYDQRKHYEAAEANAIGTEYLRADLLPAADAVRVRTLLGTYLDQRVLFYETRDAHQLRLIDGATARLQTDLWSAVQVPAVRQPTLLFPRVLSGMNEVLDLQGYAQAAWWNRIPAPAWGLMIAISLLCNFLMGYGMHRAETRNILLLLLPIVLSISFFLIGDIDSPRGGVIRVHPQNLEALSHTLRAH
jgi:hypothetical protein